MNTVLVVAYHYPPEEGSCSEKNTRIVKKLLDENYNVIVLTKMYHGVKLVEVKEKLTVLRTRKNGALHKIASFDCVSKQNVTVGTKGKIKRKISNSIIPDAIIDWVPEVKKTFKEYKNVLAKSDIILSISSPYSAHLASRYLAQKLNIPFVMCYGDPWVYEPKRKRGKIRYKYEKRMEKNLIDLSSKVVLITDWNKKKYEELYDISKDKVYTYNIGYDASECLEIKEKENDGTLKIIYGGSLDKVHRDPEPFIKAMAKVDDVRAYIFNSDNTEVPMLIEKYGVQDKVILKPIISSKEFYKKLYEMDVLLLFGNKTPFQVPGKVFTYISTEKGILYIKNNNSDIDGTQKVLDEYGNAITIKNTSEEIVECLDKMKENKGSNKSINAKQFEFHNTMQPIVNALNAVLEK